MRLADRAATAATRRAWTIVAFAVPAMLMGVLAVARALKGPTVFDRVLAGNSVGTLAILLLAVVGFLTGRPEWLDIVPSSPMSC